MKYFDRIRVSCETIGQGTLTLGAESSNSFMTPQEAGAIDGDRSRWVVEEGLDFEIFEGVIGGSVTTLTREKVLISKIEGVVGTSKINLSGNATIRLAPDSDAFKFLNDRGILRVRACATANLTIADDLEAGDSLDSITLVENDLVLVPSQTADSENGIYQIQGSGAPVRYGFFSTFDEIAGSIIIVMEGTIYSDTIWKCTSNFGGTIDSNDLIFSRILELTNTERTKLGNISVTGAVDLDLINTRVNELDAAVIIQGTWDASTGSFPGSGDAQAGDSYIVSVAGTVDGEEFEVNDRIIAITDDASVDTFTGNWYHATYVDSLLAANIAFPTSPALDNSDGTDVEEILRDFDDAIVLPSVQSVSTAYTVVASDDMSLINVSASSSNKAISLPDASSVRNGFHVGFRKSDSSYNLVTVNSEEILAIQGDTVWYISDGTSWFVTNRDYAGMTRPIFVVPFVPSSGDTFAWDGPIKDVWATIKIEFEAEVGNDDVRFRFRFRSSGGDVSSNVYNYGLHSTSATASGNVEGDEDVSTIDLCRIAGQVGSANGEGVTGEITMYRPGGNGLTRKSLSWIMRQLNPSSILIGGIGTGEIEQTSPVDGFRLLTNGANNISDGWCRVYGQRL